MDSRCFESKICNGGGGWLSSENHLPGNWKKGPVQLKKIAAQLSTIGAQLILVVSNPKFAIREAEFREPPPPPWKLKKGAGKIEKIA